MLGGSREETRVAAGKRRPTSADVAEASGVSRATVSYVLNDVVNQAISTETSRRVREAAGRLGYAPYAPARALRSGRSDVILFLIPEWPIGPAIASLIEHLSTRLADTSLTLVVHAHPRSARPVSDLWKTIAPAAVINHQALSAAEEATARRAGMLVVTPVFQPRGGKTFRPFQRRIGELQVKHLVEAGHRRLAEEPRVTAVCAYNDETGLAVLAGMRTQGVTAPQDLAVIGVDDIPAARLNAPALTTVATGM